MKTARFSGKSLGMSGVRFGAVETDDDAAFVHDVPTVLQGKPSAFHA